MKKLIWLKWYRHWTGGTFMAHSRCITGQR